MALIAAIIGTQAVSAALSFAAAQPGGRRRSAGTGAARPTPPVDAARPFLGLASVRMVLPPQRLDILLLGRSIAGPAVTGIYSAAYNIARVRLKRSRASGVPLTRR